MYKQTEQQLPMFVNMVAEAALRKNIQIVPRSMAIVKRGLCTFVEKSRYIQQAGGHLSVVVNTENELGDMVSSNILIANSFLRDVRCSLSHVLSFFSFLFSVCASSCTFLFFIM